MLIAVNVLLVGNLISIAFLDFQKRVISLGQLLILGGLCVVQRLVIGFVVTDLLFNLAWISFMFGSVLIYCRYKLEMDVFECVAIGDWLFLIAISPLFESQMFVLVLTSGFILSLVVSPIIRYLQIQKIRIPLAGILGFWIAAVLCYQLMSI